MLPSCAPGMVQVFNLGSCSSDNLCFQFWKSESWHCYSQTESTSFIFIGIYFYYKSSLTIYYIYKSIWNDSIWKTNTKQSIHYSHYSHYCTKENKTGNIRRYYGNETVTISNYVIAWYHALSWKGTSYLIQQIVASHSPFFCSLSWTGFKLTTVRCEEPRREQGNAEQGSTLGSII